jgi:alpha-glucosidase
VARVRDHYNELAVSVEENAGSGDPGTDRRAARPPVRRLTLRVRAFDDGIGFRYELPAQPGIGEFEITEELTEFHFADNARAWSIPSDRPRMDRSEML